MSLVTWGLGPSGGGDPIFTMRAFHTVFPTGYVYWTVSGVPDSGAASAPYPAIELADIVVVREALPAP
jgi:hypothetical protein